MPADGDIGKRVQIPTNLRLLVLLEEVVRVGHPITASALADALNLPKPTVHRLLSTAYEEGLLERHVDGRSFGAGRRLQNLATRTLSILDIRTERLSILTRLAEQVGETCNLAIPGPDGMVYLDRVETHWPLRIQLPAGTRVPFHCTASGKLFLSSLRSDRLERMLQHLTFEKRTAASIETPEELNQDLVAIRRRGYATDQQEFMQGMVAVAVPIRDQNKQLLSTLSIHAPVQRQSVSSLEEIVPLLLETAQEFASLAAWPLSL